jgi:DNA helicase-2/ATP-dependent DNA helicase PcrA
VIDTDALLADLTPPQRAAATHVDGPLLIVAAAGSGKTRVITRRVAYLVAQGIPPSAILAITFTNKAAGEMKERVSHVLGRQVRDFGRLDQPWPTICTFHSLCLRILRHYATKVGLGANFSIYDSADQTKLIKEALKVLDVSSDNFAPGTVHATISNAKNALVTPEQFAGNARDFYHRTAARVYAKYQALLAQNNALDFDDLMLRVVLAFREHPDVLAELQERYQYILIDEYQDTNHAQYMLAHLLAMRHRNIGVVGDPDQSIYAWRGADLKNILEFERDYPDAHVVRLEQNYRSTKTILAIASDLIAKNIRRKDKALWTENPQGEKAELTLCQDEHDEALVVMRRLRDLHEKQAVPWSDMAVFYRMNSLSRVMEEALFKNQVPYQIARGTEFYNRKEIKDVLAYLRLVANPADEVSLGRIANVPTRGLGDASLKQIQARAIANGVSLFAALGQAQRITGVSTRAANAAVKFVEMVTKWRAMAGIPDEATGVRDEASGGGAVGGESGPYEGESASNASFGVDEKDESRPEADQDRSPSEGGSSDPAGLFAGTDWDAAPLDDDAPVEGADDSDVPFAPPEEDAGDLAFAIDPALAATPTGARPVPGGIRTLMEEVVRSSGMEAHLRKIGDADLSELKNVEELISAAAEFDEVNPTGTLADYLAQVSLVSDVDKMNDVGGAVTLMTLHAAKGLEFPVVAIIGIEDGVLPHSRSRDNLDEQEEERRLFFVGITRAQERLILSKAQFRTLRGMRERTIPSVFLKELPADHLTVEDRTGLGDVDHGSGGPFGRRTTTDREGSYDRELAGFRLGQAVRHPTFGVGKILELSGAGSKTRAVIDFGRAGRKTLIVEAARLERVG